MNKNGLAPQGVSDEREKYTEFFSGFQALFTKVTVTQAALRKNFLTAPIIP